MALPDTTLPEDLSLVELRALVDVLVGEVRRLQADNAALRTENQALRDEVARLKGLPSRPPSRPSGMEKATEPGTVGKSKKRSRRRRGAKRDREVTSALAPAALVGQS